MPTGACLDSPWPLGHNPVLSGCGFAANGGCLPVTIAPSVSEEVVLRIAWSVFVVNEFIRDHYHLAASPSEVMDGNGANTVSGFDNSAFQ